MTKFNYSSYEEDESSPNTQPVKSIVQIKPVSSKKGFNYSSYEEEEPEKDQITQSKPIEEKKEPEGFWQRMIESFGKAAALRTYAGSEKHLPELVKGVLSGATIGATEQIPGMEHSDSPVEELGKMIGIAAPFGFASKTLALPLKAFSKVPAMLEGAYHIVSGGIVASGHEAAREAINNEELDSETIALHGATAIGIGALISGGVKGAQWLKKLSPSQRQKVITEGLLPDDITKTTYELFQNEVVPEMRQIAEQEYQTALAQSIEKNNAEYQQTLANTKAHHERELYELENKTKKRYEDFINEKKTHDTSIEQIMSENEQTIAKNNSDYENKIKQVAAEHQNKLQTLEQENQIAQQEFQKADQEYQRIKQRDELVKTALNRPREKLESLQGRVKVGGTDTGVRPAPGIEKDPSVRNQVGSIISPNEITNTTSAGYSLKEAVNTTAQADYKHVNNLYSINRELNKGIETEAPNLVNWLQNEIGNLQSVPELSSPKKHLLTVYRKTLDRAAIFNQEGVLIGYKPIPNQVLLDQAQELRHSIDYDFAQANPSKIVMPAINALQDAAETAAQMVNSKAYEANVAARTAYREWSEIYNNTYINKFRDQSNHNYSELFKNIDIDDFRSLNNILSKTGEGRELANTTKRELISKYLKKFEANAKLVNTEEFNLVMRELEPITTSEERQAIRQVFNKEAKTLPFHGKQKPNIKQPEAPTEKTIDTVKIPNKKEPALKNVPEFKKEAPVAEEITHVNITPKPKPEISNEMKAAAKIQNLTNEEAVSQTDTVTGLREMKDFLSKTDNGKKLYKNIVKSKSRDMLFGDKMRPKYTGKELDNVFNDTKQYDMFVELLGKEGAEDLRLVAKELGEEQASREALINKAKSLKKFAFLTYLGL